MRTIKTFLAYSTNNHAYICLAFSKKQMKAAGMNMRLDWAEEKDEETANRRILCDGHELAKSTNVSGFKY